MARLLLQKPDIIVLEDALSALDPASQSQLLESIVFAKPEATLIYVGGRDAPGFAFDRTLHLVAGEEGSVLLDPAREAGRNAAQPALTAP